MIASPSNRSSPSPRPAKKPAAEAEILFQHYFKSVGPRTYAAQLKKAGNGNHFLVFTEGKRDENTGEVRKTRLFVFSEDFAEFFKMLHETAVFIRQNPVPPEVMKKRDKYWARQKSQPGAPMEKGSPTKPPVAGASFNHQPPGDARPIGEPPRDASSHKAPPGEAAGRQSSRAESRCQEAAADRPLTAADAPGKAAVRASARTSPPTAAPARFAPAPKLAPALRTGAR